MIDFWEWMVYDTSANAGLNVQICKYAFEGKKLRFAPIFFLKLYLMKEVINMAQIDLSKYGITGATEIIYNPSYEKQIGRTIAD